ncbi:rhomboid family intramembrane serine protease [Pararhodobacter oceanensis]|uniref:rhomboid family intramembrane serine protease n=1 Tax=Pararhodobacter oceanensis TaxID=2172121 RepID=UPI003A94134B
MTKDLDDQGDADPLADLNASPLNPLPGAVWLLLLAILGVEAVLWAASAGLIGGPQAIGWRIEAIQRFGFSSAVQNWMLENRAFPGMHLLRYGTFTFIHGTPMHALFGAVLVAALGKALGDAFGAVRFLLLALLTPILGAICFGLAVGEDAQGWLFGAMPMAFALVGGFTWLRWHEAEGDGTRQRRAFAMIGILLAARLGFGLLAETGPGWVAELAAFVIGYALSAWVLGPGSWRRLRARIRR